MTPASLDMQAKKGIGTGYIFILFLAQVVVNLVFTVIVSSYLLNTGMRHHEFRDTLQDMRINAMAGIVATKYKIEIDLCFKCHGNVI